MQIFSDNSSGCHRLIAGGVIASLSASICCVGPFLLLATGISGVWMGKMMLLEPFQPILVAVSLAAFAMAGLKLLRAVPRVAESGSCQIRRIGSRQTPLYFVSLAITLVLLSSEYWIVLLA